MKEDAFLGERDVESDSELPSISNIRIRLTPFGELSSPVVIPLGPLTSASSGLSSTWLEKHPEYIEDEAVRAAVLEGEELEFNPEEQTAVMPGELFTRTGPTRTQVLAAAAAGVSVDEYMEGERMNASASAGGTSPLANTSVAPLNTDPAYLADALERTKKLAEWHTAHGQSTALATAPVVAPLRVGEDGRVHFTFRPYKVVAIYTAVRGITLKPRDAKGPKGFVPEWVQAGAPVDAAEEEKRVARKTQWARKNQERQAERVAARATGTPLTGDAAGGGGVGLGEGGASGDEFDEEFESEGGYDEEGGLQEDEEPESEKAESSDDDDYGAPAAKRSRTAGGGGKGSGSAKSKASASSKSAKAKPALHTMPAPDDATCCICNSGEGFIDDPIVLCEGDKCGIAVHKHCYGISEIPQGDAPYYCSLCTARQAAGGRGAPDPAHAKCMLCDLVGGAYKRTAPLPHAATDATGKSVVNSGWVHATCALWCPTCRFGDDTVFEPVTGWDDAMHTPEWQAACIICERANAGYSVKCAHPGCTAFMHPLCGRRAHYRMELQKDNHLRAYCTAHRGSSTSPAGNGNLNAPST